MGLLKNLFGKNENSGIPQVIPLLKPVSWAGKVSSSGTFVRPFFAADLESERDMVIGYGIDEGEIIRFLNQKDMVIPIELEKLHQVALINLEKQLIGHNGWKELHAGNDMKIIVYTGHESCAEAILSPLLMKEAHERLESKQLLASAPVRGSLYLMDANCSPEACYRFAGANIHQYYDSEEPPVSPKVWIVIDGKIEGYVQGTEELEKKIAAESRERRDTEEDKISINSIITEDENGQTVYLTIYTEEPELLLKTYPKACMQMAQKINGNSEMSGKIKAMIALTPAIEEKRDDISMALDHMVALLNKQCKQANLGPRSGETVIFSYEIGDSPF